MDAEPIRLQVSWPDVVAALHSIGIPASDLISLKLEGGQIETVHMHREGGRMLVPPATVHRTYMIKSGEPEQMKG